MNLLEAFEKQAVSGISGVSDKVIETLISKLFFFGDKVYKVYKWNKAFFGDFSSLAFRKEFYEEDFFWNNAMAPHIYLDLKPVKFDGHSFVETDIDDAEDLYIVMNKIDEKDNLTKKLIGKDISAEDLRVITREMTAELDKLTKEKIDTLKDVIGMGLFALEKQIVEELRAWCYMADPLYTKEKTDKVLEVLLRAITDDEYLKNFKKSDLSLAIDNHSDNILFSNGKLGFLDIFPPRDIWRIVDPFYNICRLATDVAVLQGRDLANEMYDEYKKIMPLGPEKIKSVYELKAALIKGPYLAVLKRGEEAQKYFDFIEQKILEIK